MGERPPRLRRDGLPPLPEADDSLTQPELSGEALISSGVDDDLLVGPHDQSTVRSAHSFVKCDLHTEPRYAKRMSDVANRLEVATRLKLARERAGWQTAAKAAEAMGAKYYSYAQHENGIRGFSTETAKRYAKFFKVTPTWLLYGDGEEPTQMPQKTPESETALTPISRHVPVLGEVQAGEWRRVSAFQYEPSEYVPVDLPAFARAQLYALRVVGESMNLVFKPGTRVIVCPTIEIGLREDLYVVVRRERAGEVETTIKQVAREPSGEIVLWPRSSHPDFQEPIHFKASRDSDEGVEIVGVVVAEYSVMAMPTTPLIHL
jgi:SOS-response transcriptional repressor LexA